MNFCLKRQHCFVCAVLLYISLFFLIFNYIPDFFFLSPFLHTNGRPNCGHGAHVYSCFCTQVWMVLVLRSEWLSPEGSRNVQCLMSCTHKPSQLTIPGCWAVPQDRFVFPALHLPLWSRPWDVASVWGLARSINVFHNQCESEFAICSWFAH